MKRFYPEMKNEILICVTEKHSKEDIDRLAGLWKTYETCTAEAVQFGIME